MKIKVLIFCLVMCFSSSNAQLVKDYNPWKVTKDGNTFTYPFWGGINNPKPTFIDINNDNLTDLLLGDISGNITYLENQGTLELPNWVVITEHFASIDVGTWFTFTDIDSDGDLDLFCDSRTAKVYYYQNNSVGNNFQFTLIDTAFGDFLAGNNNTPTFCDIDNDGDQDFFYGNTTGYLSFYENIGDSVNPSFDLPDNVYDSIYAFPQGLLSTEAKHGFSNINFADIDNDNDYDLFWGDIFNQNMYLFINTGSSELSNLIWQTQNYLPNTTLGFNHPTFADVDNDDDLDLLIGVANSSDNDNLLFYRNNGIAEVAQYILEDTNLISNIDIGSTSVPAFGDMDSDLDLDMIIGNISGQLTYYENIGSRYAPKFDFITDSYKDIDVGFSSAPFIVDYDNDGDLDFIIGDQSGRVEYWRNDGSKLDFQPTLVTNQLAGIKRDQLIIPQMIDLNNDGLKDLVIGEWDFNSRANVFIYRNIGDFSNPNFVPIDSALLNNDLREFTNPYFYDYDNDSVLDLLLSNRNDGITFYKNFGSANSFPRQADLILQPDTLIGSSDGFRLTPIYVDIDFDNDMDLFIGEKNGGVNFYQFTGDCCQGLRGNVDMSLDNITDISDLVLLANYMFSLSSVTSIPCEQEAEVTGNSIIDISDLVKLVSFFLNQTSLNISCE